MNANRAWKQLELLTGRALRAINGSDSRFDQNSRDESERKPIKLGT